MSDRKRFANAAIIGVGQSKYVRRPEPHQLTQTFMRDALLAVLADCDMKPTDIDGMAVATMSLAPDTAIDLAWRLGLSLNWIHQDVAGGSSRCSR